MASYSQHVIILCTLFFSWILAIKSSRIPDIFENGHEKDLPLTFKDKTRIFLSSEDAFPSLSYDRSSRSVRKVMTPRATRIGDNLFTARGYGKRSSKSEMALLSARRFGKRNEEKINTFLCIIMKCKNYSQILNIDEDVVSVLERRDKEIPDEIILDQD